MLILKKIISLALIILHLLTFGPARDALAFSAQSASYTLSSGALNAGGNSRSAASIKLWQDAIGEPCIGQAQSTNYILNSGLLLTIQDNLPILKQDIPYQSWAINSAKDNAFDLDDYFSSPEGYPLSFNVIGNSQINITIDPATHVVSFSQNPGWFGVEKVYFKATDTQGASALSNEVVLQVANSDGQPNKPVILDSELTPSVIKEGDLLKLTVKAYDLDNDDLTFSYSDFFTETRHWKEGDFWYSEATWQTQAHSTGHYNVRVTVSDTTTLTDTTQVVVNIGNFNHKPVLDPISDITAEEGELVTITPHAADVDNDPIIFYYSFPFDAQGKWLTNYDSSGIYNIQVTASDGIDTVSETVKVTINNTNRPPQVTLTLSKYTVTPNEVFNINLTASDPDGDGMTFSLKKDGSEISSGTISPAPLALSASFSDIGDHTISATVTDSEGLSTAVTRGVDVANPNADRYSINPVMGDFNGDALVDLGLHDSTTGKWEICLSDAGVFRNAVDWLSGFGTSKDWLPIGGDFNGDGKTDIGIYNNTTGELKIALSDGSGFREQGSWLTFPSASYSWQAFTGNFNADKYTDFALYNKDTGEVKVALCTGSGFGPLTTWLNGFGNDYIAMSADFNADGLSDLCLFKKSSGEFKVAFSNSAGFVDGQTWISGFATDNDALVSDFNNDGLADIGYWDKSSGRWFYAISSGSSFVNKDVWLENFGGSPESSSTTGDFDGNGITDAAVFERGQLGIDRWTVRLSTDRPADLLTEVDNGIGGKTQVSYTYAAKADNSDLPFPVYVASSISLVNAYPLERAATYTQDFIFSGGYYDAVEREFRGFAKVRVTDPITSNYSETFFYQGKPGQDGALRGQIEKIVSYDGNSRKISQTLNTYEVRKSGSEQNLLGFPALTETTTTIWEENDTYLTTKNNFTYDNIGNLLEEISQGDTSKLGDEKSTATTYAQAYTIGFNRPLESLLKDKDGNIVSKKNFEYDTKGNLIKDTAEIYNPLTSLVTHPSSLYTYDSFGNLISSTNVLGSTVTTEYETDFYTYPQKVTNSLGQAITYIYEPKFGVVKSSTDANGVLTATEYDSLGRVVRVTKDDGAGRQITASTYTYPDFNTKISTNAIGLSATEYIDGLGRKYKSVSAGEDGSIACNVSTEVFYNNRGLVEKESLAHYIDEDPAQTSYTRYEYDIRGRVKKTIADFPGTSKDAESSINYISPLYTETTDPLGKRKGTLKDAYGNTLEVTEFTSGGVFKTNYVYDTQNNLIKTTDSQSNIAQVFYDSSGRKIRMADPDMGTWNYEYDLAGNLIKQIDALGQVLEFQYDALNRLTKKTRDDGRGKRDEVSYTYDEPDKPECIGRLSKVTDPSGSTEFFYDKLGREIKSVKTVNSSEFIVQREYDILDRLTKLTYPDGEIVFYTYDANSGLLEKVQGTNTYVQDITYNAKGQIKAIIYGNGTQASYTYGQDLRLSRIFTQGTSTLQDLNYSFDKNGNLSTLTDNLKSNIRTFRYDDLDRLTEAQNVPSPAGGYANFSYQYDSIGNMVYKSDLGVMTYGLNTPPHALSSAGGYSYQYDANGNMVSGRNKTLSYDAENRLIEANESGRITSFLYDGDGGRVKKYVGQDSTIYIGSLFETTDYTDGSRITRKHIFVGANRIATVSLGGSAPSSSLRGTPSEARGTEAISYYHSDHLGSSNVITDSSGTQVESYEYTPYGGIASSITSRPSSIKHLYTGKELDATGLYFYGARYYDPAIGRFITADSIVQAPYDPQSLNRYSYCRNNPINYVDPTGHWSWKKFWHAAVGAVLGVALAIVLGPAGMGMSMTMAGMWGGMAGGALTGGLEGGWKGALMGAAMGGALGALGGWAAGGEHYWAMAGMLAAGAGVAGATNSWDSFAGGLAGGLAGWAVGSGITSAYSEQFGNFRAGNGFVSNQDAALKATASLKIDLSDDPPVLIYNRGIQDGPEGKPYGVKIHPIMKDWEGNYHELENANGRIKILEGKLSNMSRATRAYMAGNPKPDDMTMVYGSKFFQAIKSYKATYEGRPYVLFDSLNKNPDEFNCVGFKNYVINNSKYE